jgi:mannosyltransferase
MTSPVFKHMHPDRANKRTARTSAIGVGAILVLLVVVATLVRFFGISDRPMYDEALSWTCAKLPWIPFWKVMWNYEGNMVFYYLLLRAWIPLGDSEAVLRSLSVFFAVGTLPAVYDLGFRLFNRRTGLTAAALLAIHAFHILWSQQARSYALLTLLLVISTSLLVSALRAPQPRKAWVAYVIVSALACYCHVLAMLVLIAQWLWVGTTVESGRFRRGLGGLLWVTILIAPMGLYVVVQNKGQLEWVPPLTGARFLDDASVLGGGTGFASKTETPLLLLSTALCIVGSYFGFRSAKSFHSSSILVVCWLLFPTAAMAAFSLVKPFLVERYLLMCVPALVLLLAFALDQLLASNSLRIKCAGAAAGVMIFGLGSWASAAQYRAVVKQANPFRDMTLYILAQEQSGDAAIFFTPAAHLSFKYYSSFGTADQRQNLPKIVIPNFGNTPSGAQPIPSVDEVRSASEGYRRVWLVLNLSSISLTPAREAAAPVIWFTLLEKFDLSEKRQIGNFLVCRFVRRVDR